MINIQDLIDRFGEAEIINQSDRNHYQTINEVVVNRAINDAVALVESHLNPTELFRRSQDGELVYKYATVQAPIPAILTAKTCDIARYYLYDDGTTEIIEARYKQALDWLKQVANSPKMLTGDIQVSKNTITAIANPKPSIYQD